MGIQLQVAPPVTVDMSPNAPLPMYTPNPSFQDIQFSSHPQPRYVTTVAEVPEPVEGVPASASPPSTATRFNTDPLSGNGPQMNTSSSTNNGNNSAIIIKPRSPQPVSPTKPAATTHYKPPAVPSAWGLIRPSDESSTSSTAAANHFAITGRHPTNRVNQQFEHSIARRSKCIIVGNANTSASKSHDTFVSPSPVHLPLHMHNHDIRNSPYALEDIQFSSHPRPNVAIVIQADENTTTCGSTTI
ncbi:hypothetical protein KI688_000910 [Linnemannia hyalina]|uniref:Uncharacterized protein n=1 Tax=Linnemannia hyalina TaxID=64524 RepID=A0A9P7Y6V3_9FUNG|nr:hypothetical protein KI688_000910 [Linnemannia hyalina]